MKFCPRSWGSLTLGANFVNGFVEPSAAKPQLNFGLSPAKTQRPQRKKYSSELSVLGALAGGISESEMFRILGKFAQAAQIFKHHEVIDKSYAVPQNTKIQITVMPAGMAGIQPRKDASGNIHVNLDSSSPCWNDVIERFFN